MRKKLILFLLILAGLLFLLGTTSPDDVEISVYLLVFSLIYILLILVGLMITGLAYPSFSNQKRFFISVVAAFCPLTLLALGTMSTISAIDFFLAIIVPLIVIWYGVKRI
jgi:hypothetical protein